MGSLIPYIMENIKMFETTNRLRWLGLAVFHEKMPGRMSEYTSEYFSKDMSGRKIDTLQKK